jgi:hypothetical protein
VGLLKILDFEHKIDPLWDPKAVAPRVHKGMWVLLVHFSRSILLFDLRPTLGPKVTPNVGLLKIEYFWHKIDSPLDPKGVAYQRHTAHLNVEKFGKNQ